MELRDVIGHIKLVQWLIQLMSHNSLQLFWLS